MRKVLHYFAQFARLIRLSFKHRHVYRSILERAKVFRLRLAATGPGRRFASTKLFPVELNPPFEKIYLRQATSDVLVLHEIFELGIYEPAAKWKLPPKSVIMDLGGNIGLATKYFAALFPTANLVVVEPEPNNRQILEMNCRSLLDTGRAKLVGAFVGARDYFAGIDRASGSWGFRKVNLAEAKDEPIECLSIRSLLRRTEHTQIDLVKCDIEGSEAELFGSCGDWIGAVRYLIVETHLPYSLKALYQDLREHGWDFDITKEWQGDAISQCFLQRKCLT
jgi:FkbM family methyltransferase